VGARWRRCAGLVLLVGLSAVACSAGDGDEADDGGGSGEPGAATEGPAWVEATRDASEVVSFLVDERSVSVLELIGVSDAVEQSPVSLADARSATDDAMEELGSASGDDASPAVPPAETVSMLAAARADVDRMLPSSGMTNTDAANAAFDDYISISDEYWGGIEAAVLAVDDPDLRTALELVFDSGRMQDLSVKLVMQLIMVTIDSAGIGPDQVSAITSTWSQLDTLATEARSTRLEPYAGAIDAGFPTEYHDAMAGQWQSVADGRPVDIAELMSAQPDPVGGVSYRSLQTDLLNVLATEHG
jgi:hypothetical protein